MNRREEAKQLRYEKKYEDAINIYKKIWEEEIKKGNIDIWLSWEYADSLKKNGNIDCAIDICKQTYYSYPKAKINNNLLSWCLYEKYIKNILSENITPNNVDDIVEFITKNASNNKFSAYETSVFRMIEYYEKKENNPQKVKYWIEKVDKETLSEAPYEYENSKIEGASRKEKWYFSKIKCLYKLGEYDECIEVCNEAIETINNFHYDSDIWILLYKAKSLYNKSKEEKMQAIKIIEELIKKKRQWHFYYELAQMYNEININKTRENLLQALILYSDDKEIKMKTKAIYMLAEILEASDEKMALKHYCFYYNIREKEVWKISQTLVNKINILKQKTGLDNVNVSYKELRQYWIRLYIKESTRFEGKIIKIFGKHKDRGVIRVDNKEIYFAVKSFLYRPKTTLLNKNVEFNIIKSYDKKKKEESEEAINILLGGK